MSDSLPEGAIPKEDLEPTYGPYRDGQGKTMSILSGTSSIISIVSSSLLIWMILRTPKHKRTTQHRVLLGMSICDILFSLSFALFNTLTPKELDYIVWNAHGTQETCSAIGFVGWLGILGTLLYSCSLNIYYLAVIKYGKTDAYIRAKVEPFLHGIPIASALIYSIIILVKQNINSSMIGSCFWSTYDPPHCIGYENGEVREGFDIPCGRGYDGVVNFWYIAFLTITFLTPIVIGVSLGMMYWSVKKQERQMARYGTGTLNLDSNQQTATDREEVGTSIASSLRLAASSVKRSFQRTTPTVSEEQSNSRRVLHRALAYAFAYLLTWIWPIIYNIVTGVGADVPTWLVFCNITLNPLQGFFNFVVFLHPNVMNAKRSQGGELSWCQAIGKVIFPGRDWGKTSTTTPAAKASRGKTSQKSTLGESSKDETNNRPPVIDEKASFHVEEEKVEIQDP